MAEVKLPGGKVLISSQKADTKQTNKQHITNGWSDVTNPKGSFDEQFR